MNIRIHAFGLLASYTDEQGHFHIERAKTAFQKQRGRRWAEVARRAIERNERARMLVRGHHG